MRRRCLDRCCGGCSNVVCIESAHRLGTGPAFALTVAKGGPKNMKKSTSADCQLLPGRPGRGILWVPGERAGTATAG
jgi:hypothetical protein